MEPPVKKNESGGPDSKRHRLYSVSSNPDTKDSSLPATVSGNPDKQIYTEKETEKEK
jgi:hypothetical protein